MTLFIFLKLFTAFWYLLFLYFPYQRLYRGELTLFCIGVSFNVLAAATASNSACFIAVVAFLLLCIVQFLKVGGRPKI